MIIIFILVLALIGLILFFKIREVTLFKKVDNPYHRVCKKCGAHQVMYTSFGEYDWWGEIYPIGNDENCRCHSYAEYHD